VFWKRGRRSALADASRRAEAVLAVFAEALGHDLPSQTPPADELAAYARRRVVEAGAEATVYAEELHAARALLRDWSSRLGV
jgi:hypothetical protein